MTNLDQEMRLRRIICDGHKASVSYQVTKKRIYVDKQCMLCGAAAWVDLPREEDYHKGLKEMTTLGFSFD